jgi:hypothetical protein
MSIKLTSKELVTEESIITEVAPSAPVIFSFSVQGTDDLALDTAGGQTVVIKGKGFKPGVIVNVSGSTIGVVTLVDSTTITFTSEAKSSGTYNLFVTNTDNGTAVLTPGLIYSGLPTFTTSAGSLGSYYETTTIDEQIVATEESDTITYSVVSGSLPTGATLNSAGYITGTAPVDNSSNTYTFTVQAVDEENQSSTRQFSLTINVDVITWSTPSEGIVSLDGETLMSNVTLLASSAAGYNISYTANTLPNGVFLSGNTVYGTPNTEETIVTTFTATSANTNRTATRNVTWVVSIRDIYFKQTVLLLNGDSGNNWITDTSTNNFNVTPVGDARPSAFSPYNTNWSNFFDGTGDYLTVAGNTAFDFGTGDFSVEGWVYNTGPSITSYQEVLRFSHSGGLFLVRFGSSSDYSNYFQVSITAASASVVYSTNKNKSTLGNKWFHFAFTREGSTCKVFIDGVLQNLGTGLTPVSFPSSSFSNSTNITSSGTLFIGSESASLSYLPGYISNFRIVKGSAVYTSAFTPPTTPLTAISGTSLLTCQSNRFVDKSTNNFTLTRNGDVKVTAFGPFTETDTVTGSGYFDGTGDLIQIADNAALEPTNSDWCIETWMYPTVTSDFYWLGKGDAASAAGSTFSCTRSSFAFYIGGSSYSFTTNSKIITNQWNHLAWCRNGTNAAVFINGERQSTTTGLTTSSLNNVSQALNIGGYTGSPTTGHISNFRYVIGNSVYDPTQTTLTVPSSPLTAISNTSLLTLQNRTGHNNNTFLDNSGNRFNITRNGNTTQGTFSPFSVGAGEFSNFFDGTGDSLSGIGTTSSFNFLHNATALFTIEAWVYLGEGNAFQTITDTNASGSSTIGIWFAVNNDNKLRLFITRGVTNQFVIDVSSSSTVSINQWVHIAVTYDQSLGSSNAKFYINGVADGTGNKTANAPSGSNATYSLRIGDINGSGADFKGYISNLRISNSIVYSSAFTPSTSPLTTSSQSATNVALLTCQSNRFVDNSTNAFAITRNGDVRVTPFSPFAPSAAYDPAVNGGSGYFDGSGDYLSGASNTAFALPGAFTFECWFYPNSFDQVAAIGDTIFSGIASGSISIGRQSTNTGSGWGLAETAVAWRLTSSTLPTNNTWNHIVVVRNSSNNISLFLNGTRLATTTLATSFTQNGFSIGSDNNTANSFLDGYLASVRLVKGTAVYDPTQTTLTAPTTPLTAITNTSLLCNFTNTGIFDQTGKNVLETVGNAQIDTTTKKYGTGSMEFDGTGDYLIPNGATTDFFAFGSGDFTIEFWMNFSSLASNQLIYDSRPSGTSSGAYPTVYMLASDAKIYYYANGANRISSNSAVTTGTWYHIAVSRASGTTRMFIDGVAQTQTYSDTTTYLNGSLRPTIGCAGDSVGGSVVNGFIDDLRITKGVARYTSNFTPPISTLKLR